MTISLKKIEILLGKCPSHSFLIKDNSFITIKTTIKEGEQWYTVESILYKPDIEIISFLSKTCYLSVNEKDLGLYSSVQSHLSTN